MCLICAHKAGCVLFLQDEVIAPYSLAFSLDGEKLYAGFTNTVKIFQTCRPGRSCENKPTFGKIVEK